MADRTFNDVIREAAGIRLDEDDDGNRTLRQQMERQRRAVDARNRRLSPSRRQARG